MIKKIVCMIIILAVTLFSVASVSAANTTNSKQKSATNKATSSDTSNEISFYISVYDQTKRSYPIENTKITVNNRITILSSLELLKEKEIIEDYTVKNDRLISVKFDESLIEATEGSFAETGFYMKRNGKIQVAEGINRLLENGDIIEWIYGKLDTNSVTSTTAEEPPEGTVKQQTELWTDEIQKALINGCEFLTLNQESSTMYILALGCAGKTADVKMVNDLLSDIRKTEVYESPVLIAKNILSLTFCGYDAAELISKLSLFEGINERGVYGAINALIAYDSKQYAVPIDMVNSRDKLITLILASQSASGGFALNEYAEVDIKLTAMALTALSQYSDRPQVKAAIDSGIIFLQKMQNDLGGFAPDLGDDDSTNLANVIIALSSLGIDIDDKRFVKGENTILNLLMKFKNDDGGFSQLVGAKSSPAATEQAVIALSSIKHSDNPYKMKRSLSPPPQTKTEEKNLVVTISKPPRRITVILVSLSLSIVFVVLLLAARAKRKHRE